MVVPVLEEAEVALLAAAAAVAAAASAFAAAAVVPPPGSACKATCQCLASLYHVSQINAKVNMQSIESQMLSPCRAIHTWHMYTQVYITTVLGITADKTNSCVISCDPSCRKPDTVQQHSRIEEHNKTTAVSQGSS